MKKLFLLFLSLTVAVYAQPLELDQAAIAAAQQKYTADAQLLKKYNCALYIAPVVALSATLYGIMRLSNGYVTQEQWNKFTTTMQPVVPKPMSWGAFIGSMAGSASSLCAQTLVTNIVVTVLIGSVSESMRTFCNAFGPVVLHAPFPWFIQRQVTMATTSVTMRRELFWCIQILNDLDQAIIFKSPLLIKHSVEKLLGHIAYAQTTLEPYEIIFGTELALVTEKITHATQELLATESVESAVYTEYQTTLHQEIERLALLHNYRISALA